MTSSLPSAPQVVVSGLPEFYTSDMLWEFFSEFHDVVDAQIDHGLGYITFSSFEDAHAVLDFQAHQPILVDDEHAITIEWAVQVDQTNSTVPEVLQEKEPLEETAQVATRDVVSYDDL